MPNRKRQFKPRFRAAIMPNHNDTADKSSLIFLVLIFVSSHQNLFFFFYQTHLLSCNFCRNDKRNPPFLFWQTIRESRRQTKADGGRLLQMFASPTTHDWGKQEGEGEWPAQRWGRTPSNGCREGTVSCQTDDTEEFSEFPTAERQVWLSAASKSRDNVSPWEETRLRCERGGKSCRSSKKKFTGKSYNRRSLHSSYWWLMGHKKDFSTEKCPTNKPEMIRQSEQSEHLVTDYHPLLCVIIKPAVFVNYLQSSLMDFDETRKKKETTNVFIQIETTSSNVATTTKRHSKQKMAITKFRCGSGWASSSTQTLKASHMFA